MYVKDLTSVGAKNADDMDHVMTVGNKNSKYNLGLSHWTEYSDPLAWCMHSCSSHVGQGVVNLDVLEKSAQCYTCSTTILACM